MSERKRQRSKPGVVVTPTGGKRKFREPTSDELWRLLRDLGPYARNMPIELWDRLQDFIAGTAVRQGFSMEKIDHLRWQIVRFEEMPRVGWERSFAAASEKLAGTPAEGGERAMQESYERIEDELPPELRRPHTHRRKRH
jgi:hypothetical protein